MVYSYHNIRTIRTRILIDTGTQSIGGKVDLWMESNTQYLQKKVFVYYKVVAVNSHRLPGKGRRMGPILGHTMHYRRMIITLQPGYSIPLLDRETN